MADCPGPRLSLGQRRRARRLAYWNGALWAVGTGLASSPLVMYLAMELGVARIGLGISLIKAAPHVAGSLRLAAPALIGRLADRKRFCLASYLFAAVLLAAMFLSALPAWTLAPSHTLACVVLLWCGYHVSEYLGAVALWSWLADLVPQPVRGRFLGRRERWSVTGQALAMLGAALFGWVWAEHRPEAVWAGYAIPGLLGCLVLGGSIVPLMFMVPAASPTRSSPSQTVRSILRPLGDPGFRRYIAFGCWFSFFNGLIQSAQEIFPRQILGIRLPLRLGLQMGMRIGQLALSPAYGRWADRAGNRTVLGASVPVIASSTLFFCVATPAAWYWAIGAWVAWIAYAGVNVAQPNLMLQLAPAAARPAYVAAYQTATGLCVAAAMIVGGVAFDWLYGRFGADALLLANAWWNIDLFQAIFLFGFVTRTMSLLVLLAVRESCPDDPHESLS